MTRETVSYRHGRQIIIMDLVNPTDFTDMRTITIPKFAWDVARSFLSTDAQERYTYAYDFFPEMYSIPDDTEFDTIRASIDEFLATGEDPPMQGKIVGELFIWTTDTPPLGSLFAYGQAISRVVYSDLNDLYAAAGYPFGSGDGSTTFNLPDMRGRLPLGKDNMGGVSANRVTSASADTTGAGAGAESITLAIADIPSHPHPFNILQIGAAGTSRYTAIGTAGTKIYTDNVGLGGTHNNMQPYLTVTYCIYTGV